MKQTINFFAVTIEEPQIQDPETVLGWTKSKESLDRADDKPLEGRRKISKDLAQG